MKTHRQKLCGPPQPFLLALALFSASTSHAMSYVQMADEDLVAQADGAIIGTVEGSPMPVMDRDGVRIASRYRLAVESSLGGKSSRVEQFQLPGWQGDEGSAWRAMGVVSLARNERVLLLYERRADGVLLPLHLNLGIFIERLDGLDRYYARGLDNATNAEPARNSEYNAARRANRFEIYVANRLKGLQAEVDYLIPKPSSAKFTSITGGGTPVRWFDFDQSITVNWRANSDGQAGMVQDEFQLFQNALNAWNNDATSRIQWGYAGTIAPGAANPPAPFGRVLWNDPNNQIGGTYNCAQGGVLASAGPGFQITPTLYRGTLYNPIRSAQMVTQDGAGCYFDSAGGVNGTEIFGHEVGHTLGFGHSCGDPQSPACASNPLLDDALMRALAHGDGRGASLRVDDIAASNQWYFLAPPAQDPIFANGFE
ncbi:MAG: hypothetical protein ABIP49_08645 [Lysobacterales bacterium]